MQTHRRKSTAVAAVILLTVLSLAVPGRAQQPKGNWVTAWTTSMIGLAQGAGGGGGRGGGRGGAPAPLGLSNATIRMIVRPTISGGAVRVRLENTFGKEPLMIGGAFVGASLARRGLIDGTNVKLTFGGLPTATIPAGQQIWSDSAAIKVEAGQDIAVSVYLPGSNVPITSHNGALTTSFLTPSNGGDHAADVDNMAFKDTTAAMYVVSAVDVMSSTAQAIVAFGDSITDGTCSVLDAHNRWEDVLWTRLLMQGGKEWAVVNEGIGGNTITRQNLNPAPDSPPGLERLDRDALQLSGVSHLILFEGTNDLRRDASAEQVIAGMTEIIKRVKAANIKIHGVTIIPRHNAAAGDNNSGWQPEKTARRNVVNTWIRTKAGFDSVIDFDKVVGDSANHDLLNPVYNCGDGTHPTPLGYLTMGRSIDLKVFR